MSETHIDRTRLYIKVFVALMALTLVTVGASYVHFPGHVGIVVGIFIAAVKAGLVVSIFMHLKWEKKTILTFLGITVFFAFFLFALPIVDFLWLDTDSPHDVAADGPSHGSPRRAEP